MHYVILRDDDTCAFTPKACLERLYRPFLQRGLPVNLAVIPAVNTAVRTPDGRLEGFLTAGSGPSTPVAPIGDNRELVDYLRAEPGYDIVHHGCHHDYFEFGSTDRSTLARRLDVGATRLRAAGLREPAAFVAPYDRFSREAFLEVAERFNLISTGWFEARRLPVSWWPAYAGKKLGRRAHWRHGRTTLLSHPGCLLSFHRKYEEMLASVQQAGYGGLSVDDLVRLRDRGVSASFLEGVRRAHYRPLAPSEALLLQDHGVSAEFMGEVVAAGYGDATPVQIAEWQDHGVSGETLRRAHAFGRKPSPEEIIRLLDHGVI